MYEEHNKNSDDTRSGQEASPKQGVSVFGDYRELQEPAVTIGRCENTTQGGTGRFYKQKSELEI